MCRRPTQAHCHEHEVHELEQERSAEREQNVLSAGSCAVRRKNRKTVLWELQTIRQNKSAEDMWNQAATIIRKIGTELLGVSRRKGKVKGKEAGWWNEKVQGNFMSMTTSLCWSPTLSLGITLQFFTSLNSPLATHKQSLIFLLCFYKL